MSSAFRYPRLPVFILLAIIVLFSASTGFSASTASRAHSDKIKLIVIDAGHGGNDTGAIGPGGTQEKDITLNLARRLKKRLETRTGIKVLLTRDSDEFWELSRRTNFANAKGADIFISIHVNAARRKGARGVETFFLSFNATDDEARKTAAFENNIINLKGKTEDVPSDDISAILWDMTQTQAHHESSRLAQDIYLSLFKAMGGQFRGVKQAPFHVLVGATMPAVLIEVGFITNPREEKRLVKQKTQRRITEAIGKGVITFVREVESASNQLAAGDSFDKK